MRIPRFSLTCVKGGRKGRERKGHFGRAGAGYFEGHTQTETICFPESTLLPGKLKLFRPLTRETGPKKREITTSFLYS